MKVKITQASFDTGWYNSKIGQVIEVRESKEEVLYWCADAGNYIHKSDCIPVEDDEVQAVTIEVTDDTLAEYGQRFTAVRALDGYYRCTERPYTFHTSECCIIMTFPAVYTLTTADTRTPIGWRLDIDIPEWGLKKGQELGKIDAHFKCYGEAMFIPLSVLAHIATPIYPEPKPDANGWWKFEERKPERGSIIWTDVNKVPIKYEGIVDRFTKWQPCVKPPM